MTRQQKLQQLAERVGRIKIRNRHGHLVYYNWGVCPKCSNGRWIRGDGDLLRPCKACSPPPRLVGKENPRWQGGYADKIRKPYLAMWIPADHPYASMRDRHNYVLVHRLVMAEHLKRALTPEEIIHHIDGNPRNNSINNLQLLPRKGHDCSYNAGYRQGFIDGTRSIK